MSGLIDARTMVDVVRPEKADEAIALLRAYGLTVDVAARPPGLCYACDAPAAGVRRRDGGTLGPETRPACARHRDAFELRVVLDLAEWEAARRLVDDAILRYGSTVVGGRRYAHTLLLGLDAALQKLKRGLVP